MKRREVLLFLFLFLLWILLSGKVTVEIVLVGAAVSAALTFFTPRIIPGFPRYQIQLVKRIPSILGYLIYLLGQVFLSSFSVIRLILCPGNGRPKLVWFALPVKGPMAQLTLANSITLTPGTVTVSLGKNVICVYALRGELAENLEDCGFVKKLQRLEESDHG